MTDFCNSSLPSHGPCQVAQVNMSAHSLPSHVLSIFSDTHIPPCQNNILSSMIFLSLPLLLFPSNFSVASTYSRFPFSKDFPSPVLMQQASAIQSAVWFHLSVSSAFSFTCVTGPAPKLPSVITSYDMLKGALVLHFLPYPGHHTSVGGQVL